MKYTVPKGIEIMKIREIQEEILRLKKERDFCILAHSYQNIEVDEVADFVGDSLYLSRKAKETNADIIIFGKSNLKPLY